MHKKLFTIGILAIVITAGAAHASMPPNVRCAILAQEKARNTGSEYRKVYNRNFELCVLNTMPRERQTAYLIEKLRPYEAISPGLQEQTLKRQTSKEATFTGTWVRLSPNHWVLQRN